MASSSFTALRRLYRQLGIRRLPPTSINVTVRDFSTDGTVKDIPINGEKVSNKPPICTADELHYVFLKKSDWKLALWRYHPSPQAIPRKHPLLLLSGVGTNAIGYDLSPECSFARHMCEQGFDAWILEVRGSGLSMQAKNPKEIEQSAHDISNQMKAASASGEHNTQFDQSSNNKETDPTESEMVITNQQPIILPTVFKESILVAKLTETLITLSDRLSGFLNESQPSLISAKLFDQLSKLVGDSFLAKRFRVIKKNLSSLLESRQESVVASQTRDLSQKLIDVIEESQRSVSSPLFDLQESLTITVEGFQKQMDMVFKFDWDFDHHLEEDVPAAVRWHI